MKRSGHFREYVNDVEVRVGNISVEGAESTLKVNALCGRVPATPLATAAMTETVECSTPVRGRFVTLERDESRLELAEMSVEAC